MTTAIHPPSPALAAARRARTGALVVVAGLAMAAGMPPWGWWPLTIVGVALLDRLIADRPARSRALRGWAVGVAWLGPSTVWMLDFSIPGYLASTGILSAYLGAACAAVPPNRWRWLALPGAVALAELARWTFPFGGVPLSTLPMSQAGSPLGPIVRLGGGVALTMATVAAGVALAALVNRAWRPASVAAAAVSVLVALAAVAPRGGALGELNVAVVQGGGPQGTRAVDTDATEVFARHLAVADRVARPVDLLLLPENALTVRGELARSDEGALLAALARRVGGVVVPGFVESFPDEFRNAAVAFDPDGTIRDRYDKVLRVPYGEYVPFRSVLDPLSGGALNRYVPRDAVAGDGPAVLDTAAGRMGIVISWEVFFERRARDAIGNGGEVLLVPTNGSSYWLSIVQSQQVASSRLRALETGRWVIQAAPTGFSAIVDPDGTVVERSGIGEARVLNAAVERRSGATPGLRFGPWPAAFAAAAMVVAGWAGTRRNRTAAAGAVGAVGAAEEPLTPPAPG